VGRGRGGIERSKFVKGVSKRSFRSGGIGGPKRDKKGGCVLGWGNRRSKRAEALVLSRRPEGGLVNVPFGEGGRSLFEGKAKQ